MTPICLHISIANGPYYWVTTNSIVFVAICGPSQQLSRRRSDKVYLPGCSGSYQATSLKDDAAFDKTNQSTTVGTLGRSRTCCGKLSLAHVLSLSAISIDDC